MSIPPPFPYPGGKRRWARMINEALGDDLDVYVEPFAGSAANLLARPPAPLEIICDLNGHVANFWRAVRDAPDEVARWADNPSIHDDLQARARWLVRWADEHGDRLRGDAGWFDAKAAGWWAWGQSVGIRGVYATEGGSTLPNSTATGVSPRRAHVPYGTGGERLQPWMRAIARRLARVIVLSIGWEGAVSDSYLDLAHSRSRGILLDPPYVGERKSLYAHEWQSEDAAYASKEWAIEHGERDRIVYCGYPGLSFPDGWRIVEGGLAGANAGNRVEALYFSPACLPPSEQLGLPIPVRD